MTNDYLGWTIAQWHHVIGWYSGRQNFNFDEQHYVVDFYEAGDLEKIQRIWIEMTQCVPPDTHELKQAIGMFQGYSRGQQYTEDIFEKLL